MPLRGAVSGEGHRFQRPSRMTTAGTDTVGRGGVHDHADGAAHPLWERVMLRCASSRQEMMMR
ncbi:MAG: hypothetical protein QOG45_2636 [Chloroflexota bacterium]|nr:hypothetical protein [Chloroflexota bacterium]